MPPARQQPAPTALSSSWFTGAPLTKITSIIMIVAHFWARRQQKNNSGANGNNAVHVWALDAAVVLQHKGQWHRYFTSILTFASPAELIPAGILLVLWLRQVEREMSSRKTTMFLLWVHASSIAAQALFVVPYAWYYANWNLRYMGPYLVIGALAYHFHVYSPRITPNFISVLGFSWSDKIWHYAWLSQVAAAGGWHTVVPIALGWTTAWIYFRSNFIQKVLDCPDWIANVVANIASHVASTQGPPRVSAAGRQVPRVGGGAPPVPRAFPAAAAPPEPVAPDEAAVEQLCNMGFPRPRVIEALQATNNDVQRAADRLLTMQSN